VALVFALALALLAMGVFALSGSRRDADASRKGSQLLGGTADFLIHWFLWLLGPLERLLIRAQVSPDKLNYAGLLFGIASGVAIALGWLEWGGLAILLAGACDVLDGRIARARGMTSRFGQFIDSTLDRFVEVFAFLGFLVYARQDATAPFWTAAAMAGSLLVSYTRARGESIGVVCKAGLLQRAERLTLMCALCLAEPLVSATWGGPAGRLTAWVMALIAVGTFGTAVYRTVWISRRLSQADSAAPPHP
jgi:CDP-diacylglycerol---glycerol-3-phosphate 3-phosphatidyltransferase